MSLSQTMTPILAPTETSTHILATVNSPLHLNRLPTETLCLVFSFLPKQASIPFGGLPSIFVISHVCLSWRLTALENAALWAINPLDFPLQIASMIVQRSHPHPIPFYFVMSPGGPTPINQIFFSANLSEELLIAVAKATERACELHISVADPSREREIGRQLLPSSWETRTVWIHAAFLFANHMRPGPMLSAYIADNVAYYPWQWQRGNLPKFLTLKLSRTSINASMNAAELMRTRTIRTLELRSVAIMTEQCDPRHWLIATLADLSALEHVVLADLSFLDWERFPERPYPDVNLPALRSLTIAGDFHRLWRAFVPPPTAALRFQVTALHYTTINDTPEFLSHNLARRSAPTALTVRQFDAGESQMGWSLVLSYDDAHPQPGLAAPSQTVADGSIAVESGATWGGGEIDLFRFMFSSIPVSTLHALRTLNIDHEGLENAPRWKALARSLPNIERIRVVNNVPAGRLRDLLLKGLPILAMDGQRSQPFPRLRTVETEDVEAHISEEIISYLASRAQDLAERVRSAEEGLS